MKTKKSGLFAVRLSFVLFLASALAPSLFAQIIGGIVESTPVKVPKVRTPPNFATAIEHPEGLVITGMFLDADTGKPYANSSSWLEVTPVSGYTQCETALPKGETHLMWVQTDDKGKYSVDLEQGFFKLAFQLPGGVNAGTKFGCVVVSSRSCTSEKPRYHFVLHTTNRFRGVVATVHGTYPCSQGVRAGFFVPELPYELKSSRVTWIQEDGRPIRDAELVFEKENTMGRTRNPLPKITLHTNYDGVADLSEVYRRLVSRVSSVVVTVNDGDSPRSLSLTLRAPGDGGQQTVRVMEWRSEENLGWAGEVQ